MRKREWPCVEHKTWMHSTMVSARNCSSMSHGQSIFVATSSTICYAEFDAKLVPAEGSDNDLDILSYPDGQNMCQQLRTGITNCKIQMSGIGIRKICTIPVPCSDPISHAQALSCTSTKLDPNQASICTSWPLRHCACVTSHHQELFNIEAEHERQAASCSRCTQASP